MVYFFCALLVLVLLCGKSEGYDGAIVFSTAIVSLVYAILKTGGFL